MAKVNSLESLNDFISSNENKIISSILLVFLIINIFIAVNIQSQWAQDSHWHMSLAKNLFAGKGYTSDGIYPHGKYTPGLPLLILPFMFAVNNVQIAGLVLLAVLSLLSLLLAYKIGKMISPSVGLFSMLLLFFHNLFWFNSVSIMTEIPFMLFSLSSIYFLIKSEKNKLFLILSLFLAAFSILIRYDGLFLVFPFAYFFWKDRSNIGKTMLSKEFLIGVVVFAITLGSWFVRNKKVFGSFFYTAYSSELAGPSIPQLFNFLGLFFALGVIFSIFALFGIISFISKKDKNLNMFLIWFLAYLVLHIYWSTRVLRFYVEILSLICILSASGIVYVSGLISENKKRLLAVLLIVLIISGLQVFTFFKADGRSSETTVSTLNRYESIHQVSDWANENLPSNALYIVPDVAVYSLYLDKQGITYYNEGINYLLQNKNFSAYILSDTLHSWMTGPFMKGEQGQIVLDINANNQPAKLVISTELVKKIEYENKSSAIILQTKGFDIV